MSDTKPGLCEIKFERFHFHTQKGKLIEAINDFVKSIDIMFAQILFVWQVHILLTYTLIKRLHAHTEKLSRILKTVDFLHVLLGGHLQMTMQYVLANFEKVVCF